MAQSASPGFFLEDWTPKTIQNPVSSIEPLTSLPITTTVTVHHDSVVTKVSPSIFGHNAGVWGGKINRDSGMMRNIRALAPRVIRWPGGNLSNDYFWNASSETTCPKDLPPATTSTSAPPPSTFSFNPKLYGANASGWTMSLDDYYDMLARTNSTGILSVNYAYARYGTGADPVLTAAKYAADWVRYDKGRTRYWEIGNENYGSWETGYEIDVALNKDGQPKRISGDLYGRHAAVFISEMRKAAMEVGNDIKIGVVLFHNQYDATGSILGTWNAGVLPHVASKADYLILHNYYTAKTGETPSTILNSAQDIPKKLMGVALSDLKAHGNLETLPVALTEWNISAEGSQQQVSHVNGIHAVLNLGELIQNGWGLANRWDFLNGYSGGDSHGLFADQETDVPKYTPRAPFYYMQFFQRFFGDRLLASKVTGSADVRSYASLFSSGQCGVVLVNKGSGVQTVDLQIPNFAFGERFHSFVLTGAAGETYSRKVFINGEGPTQVAGGPDDYADLPPKSAVIENGSIRITLPEFSVAFLLVEANTTAGIGEDRGATRSTELRIFGNASERTFRLSRAVSWEVQSLQGATIQRGEGRGVDLRGTPTGLYVLRSGTQRQTFLVR